MSNEASQTIRILCVYGSPRIRGNTDTLMDAFAAGVEAAGAVAERVYLRNLKISPCREIYACQRTGSCALKDDMQPLYEALRSVDGIALASPIMFYNVSAQAKAFIDRCQAFWCIKYRRGERVPTSPILERKAVFLGVGGSKGQKLFDGALLTFRYFLETLDAVPWKSLTFRQIDEAGDLAAHPTARQDATSLGEEFAHQVRRDRVEAES